MGYKELTLEACKELIEKYEHPDFSELKGKYFNIASCPLCNIYWSVCKCTGCFMAKKGVSHDGKERGIMGCGDFITFKKAKWALEKYLHSFLLRPFLRRKVKKAFKNRALFFRKVIPILKNIPEEQFTPKGWKEFKFPEYW